MKKEEKSGMYDKEYVSDRKNYGQNITYLWDA